MNKNLIVVDDFYADPDAVRALAMEADLCANSEGVENFPGEESKFNYFSTDLIQKMEDILKSKILVDEGTNAFGKFRFAQQNHLCKTRIHFDNKDWSAVIYLTPNVDVGSGTIFVEHKKTQLIGPPQSVEELATFGCQSISEFDHKYVLPDTLNLSAWSIHLKIPFKYNRLILFRGRELFHGAESIFGHNRETARLTQNFFFNEKRL